MNVISWNLNHRTIEKPIPDTVVDFFRLKNPDIIILNEFVDGVSRDIFKNDLKDLGYEHQQISDKLDIHNQIFIASKHEIQAGDLEAPQLDDASKSNFLHATVPQANIELVGFRAPYYKTAALRKEHWGQVYTIMNSVGSRPICFIGDVNTDPFRDSPRALKEVSLPDAEQFIAPNPQGDWSYKSINGKHTSRIDHAFISSALEYANPEYITTFGDITLAGSKADQPITDHAVLSIDLINPEAQPTS